MNLPKTARAAVVAEYGKPIEIRMRAFHEIKPLVLPWAEG